MIDTTWYYLVWVVFTAVAGMMAIGAGVIGYWLRKLTAVERIIGLVAGILLIYPEGMSDIIGLGLFIGLVILQLVFKRNKPNLEQPAN